MSIWHELTKVLYLLQELVLVVIFNKKKSLSLEISKKYEEYLRFFFDLAYGSVNSNFFWISSNMFLCHFEQNGYIRKFLMWLHYTTVEEWGERRAIIFEIFWWYVVIYIRSLFLI